MGKNDGRSTKTSPARTNSEKPPISGPQVFYHGTSALAAMCISVDGFRLLSEQLRQWGEGALGNGIYVTAALETANYFASASSLNHHKYILRVRLAPGTRILRLDGNYDQNVINYLVREFGRELLGPKFDRAIPANKHLRRVELINLANYLWQRGQADKPRGIGAWAGLESLGPLRRTLIHNKYDGLGCTESDIGVAVFNPSRLLAEGVYRVANNVDWETGQDPQSLERSALIDVDSRRLANSAAQQISHSIKALSELRAGIAASIARNDTSFARYECAELECLLGEIPRQQACLRLYCARNRIAMDGPAIASALAVVVR